MRWLTHVLMTIGVATALLASSFVVAQDYRVKQTRTVKTKNIAVAKTEPKVETIVKVAVPAPVQAAVKQVMPLAAVGPGNLDPLIQQLMPQCRPLVRAEIHLVMTSCDPTKEQREKITREGERILKEVVTKYAEAQNRMNQGQWQGGAMPDARKMTEEGLSLALKSILTPEQTALYQKELAIRATAQKQVAVRALVARLDQMLILSTEQRDKLVDTLMANWNDSWGHSLEQFLSSYDERYLPMIPDKAIVPVLNELQKKVYAGTQKLQVNFFGGLGFRGGMMIEEDLLEDVRVEVAVPAVQKQAVKEQIKKK